MAQGGDDQDPVYQIAALCFDSKKFAVIVGSEIARLATKRTAASFPGLLTLGVKRAADFKFKASGEKEHYIESFTKFISTNPLDVATEIATQLPVAKFKQWIKQELNLTIRNRRPTDSLKALQKLGAQLLTTNYDTLLESARIPRAVPGSDRMLNILSSDFNELQDLILGESQGILHLFGVFRECMLFTKSDHEDYIKNEEVMQHLGTLFYQSHILFVGFQKNDPFLNTLYGVMQKKLSKRLGNMKNRHYILVPDSELAAFNEGFPGILPLPYGSSGNELVTFLQDVIGQAIEAHHRGQKRRQDTYDFEPDAKRQRLCLIGEDLEVMHRISRLAQDDFQIPPEDIEVGKERGHFASIYFTVDVAEQYVPLFWQQAQMTKNLLVQCGVMAIQVGSGPMLWMVNPYQPPPQPLAGQAQPGAGANQQDDDQHGGWKRPKRKEWHQLPPLNKQLGHVRKTSIVKDVPKDSLPKLKKHIKDHFHCAVIYKWSISDSATYHCQGERSNVDAAISYLANSQLAAKRGQRYSTWPKTLRQFACEVCDLVWWVRVPKQRPVCLCPSCKLCFKALKWADQFGFANFECQKCGQEFEGKDRFMHFHSLECPTCKENVRPYRIGPPHRKPTDSERPRNHRGSISFSQQPKRYPRMPPRKPSKTDLNTESKSQKEVKPSVLSQQAKEIVFSIVNRSEKRPKPPSHLEEQSSHPIPLKRPISMNMIRTSKQSPDSTRNQLEPLPFAATTTDLRPLKTTGLCTSKSKHQLKKEWKQQRKGKKQRTSRKVIPNPADRYPEGRQCDVTVKQTSSIPVTLTRLELMSDTLRQEAKELVVDTGSCTTMLVEANLLDHQEHSSDKELPTNLQHARNKIQEAAASQELLRLIRTCGNDSTDPKVSVEANDVYVYNGGTEGPPSGAQSLEATLPVEGVAMQDHFHEENVPHGELLQLPEHGDTLREEAKKLVDILLKTALETYSRCLARQESEDIVNHVKEEIVVSGRNQSSNIAIVTTGNGHLDHVTTPIAPNQEERESPTPQGSPNESSPAHHRGSAMPDLPPTPNETDGSVHKSSPQTNGPDKVSVLVQGTILESEVPCVTTVTGDEECHIVESATFIEEAPKLESPEVPKQLACKELPIGEESPQLFTAQMLQPSCPIKEEAPGTISHHPTTNELALENGDVRFGGLSLQSTPEPEVVRATNEGCHKHSLESASSTVLPVEGAAMRDHVHEENVPHGELLQFPEHGDTLREEAKKLVDILLKTALETYSRCLARQESEDIVNHVKDEIVVSGRNQSPNIAIATTGNGHLDHVTTPIAPNQEERESPTPQGSPNESSPAYHRGPAMPDLLPTPNETDGSVHKSSPQTNGLDKVSVLVQGTILESEVPRVTTVTGDEECHIVESTTTKEEAPKLESPEVPMQLTCKELPIGEESPQPFTAQMLQPSCPIKEEAPGTASHHPTTNELLLENGDVRFGGLSLQSTPEPEVIRVTNEGCHKHSLESASSTVLPVEGAAMRDHFHEENVPHGELLQLPEHGDTLREEAKKLVDTLLKTALETYSRCLARQESEDIVNHVKEEIVVSGRNQSPNIAIVTTGNGHLDHVTTPIAPNQERGESPTPQGSPNESSSAHHRGPAIPDLPPTCDEADGSVHKSSPQINGPDKVTVLVQGTILESEVPCVTTVTGDEECHIVESTTTKEEAPKLESPEVPKQLACKELPIGEESPQPLTAQMLQPSCPIKEEAPGTISHHPTTNELALENSDVMFGGLSLQGTPEPEVIRVTNEGCQKHSLESASSTLLPVEGATAMRDHVHEENVPHGELLQLPEHGDTLREEAKKLVDTLLKAALETYSRCLAKPSDFKIQLPTVTNVCKGSGIEIEERAQVPNKTVHLLASKTNRVKGEQLNHQTTVQCISDKPVFVCSEDSVTHTLDHKLPKEVEHSPSDHTARAIDSSSLFTLKQVPQEKHIQSTKEELPEQQSDKPIPSTQDNESREHVSAAAGREEPLSQPQTDEIGEICTIYGNEHSLGCSYEPIAEVQTTTAATIVPTGEGDMSPDGAKPEPGDKLLPATTMVEPSSESDLVSEVTCASEHSLDAPGKDATSELEQLEAQGPNLDLKTHNVATCEPTFQDVLGSDSSKQLPSMVKKEIVTSLHSQPKETETEVVPMDFASPSHSDADTATNASAANSIVDSQGAGIMDTEQVDTSTSANPQKTMDHQPVKPRANEQALDTVKLESSDVLSYRTGGDKTLESDRADITPNEDTEMGVQLEECSPSTMQQASNSEEQEGSKEVFNGVHPSMEATSEVSVHCNIHEQSSEDIHSESASTDEGRMANEAELQHSDITAPSKVQEKNTHIQVNVNDGIEVNPSELHASILNKTASDIHDTGMPEAPHLIVTVVNNIDTIEASEPIEGESSIVVEVEDLPHQTESKSDAFMAPTLSPSTDIFESPETTKEALEIHDDSNLPNQTPPPSQSEKVTTDNLNEGTSSDSEVQQLIESILSQLITAAVDSGISTTAPQQVHVFKPETELPAVDNNIPLMQTNKNLKDTNSSHVCTMRDNSFSKVEMEGGNLDGTELSEQGSERDHTNTSKHPDSVVSTGEVLPADSDATAMQGAVSLPPTEPEESSDESLSQSDFEYKSSENEDKLATSVDQSKQPITAVQDDQLQKQKSEDIGSSEFVDARFSNGSDQQSGRASVSVGQYRHNRDILRGRARASSSSPDQVNVRKKPKARMLLKFKRDGTRRNVLIPSERHECSGDTDDETKNAYQHVEPVHFEFDSSIFHVYERHGEQYRQ